MDDKTATFSGKMNEANILCLLGDIKKDGSYYERAWEVSEKRSARAMRCLARIHFYKNDMKKAIECFELAFAINRLFPNEWFTCGCAYMRLENFDKAIFCFGNTISINERTPDAWGNISNCYSQ
jgi:tetratricopeptide (TPR) repeat protein